MYLSNLKLLPNKGITKERTQSELLLVLDNGEKESDPMLLSHCTLYRTVSPVGLWGFETIRIQHACLAFTTF